MTFHPFTPRSRADLEAELSEQAAMSPEAKLAFYREMLTQAETPAIAERWQLLIDNLSPDVPAGWLEPEGSDTSLAGQLQEAGYGEGGPL